MTRRYAIIGGGIVGASIAYHLSRETQADVVLFERQSPASETTYKSVAQYGFYGDETQYKMKRYGMQQYNRFFANSKANPRYLFAGHLMVATTDENAAVMQEAVEHGGDERLGKLGIGFDRDLVEYIDGKELGELLLLPPVDQEQVKGALFRPKVGYMSRPHELAYEFLERAKENGIQVQSNTEVTAVETTKERVTGVEIDDGTRVQVDEVVCAAGPWNVRLAESVGINIPVKHTLAPILKLQLADQLDYDIPIIGHVESPYAFHRRDEDEFLLGYNPGAVYEEADRYDPDTMDETVPEEIKIEGLERLGELIPALADATVADEWVGIRSITPDGNPVVGWTDLEGFSIAAFHTSGIQLAPYVGKMITDQLVHGDPDPLYDELSITRFEGYTDHKTSG